MTVLAHRQVTTGKKGAGNPAILAAGAGFEPAGPLGLSPITQTQRPVKIGTLDGNRTHISQAEPGRSIAVELRGDQMDKWRRRYGASQAGLEPATPDFRPAALSR